MYTLHSILHPEVYHGRFKCPPFFEGWYFRIVTKDEKERYAIIPGIILGKNGHSFIQILDGVRARTTYHKFPLGDFQASKRIFDIRVGLNLFSLDGLSLNIDDSQGRVVGVVTFSETHPWPVTFTSPGIMGWYAWVPAMQCYHGVISFDHPLSGWLKIDGKMVEFEGGRGYIEKDWGSAFPEGYVWMQTNLFEQSAVCITGSVAVIPWLRSAFPGFIVGFWKDGRLYRFATYSGAKIEKLEITDKKVEWVLCDECYRLELQAVRAEAGLLKGPSELDMGKRVNETMNSCIEVRLSSAGGERIFHGTGRHAGLEVYQPDHLLEMVNK